MHPRLLLLAAILIFSAPGYASATFSYHQLQMGFIHNRIGVDELHEDLRSDGVLVVYTREIETSLFIYANLNAGTLDTGVQMQNTDFHFNGTLISAATGIGYHQALSAQADLYFKGGVAHSRYDLQMQATDKTSHNVLQNKESDNDTGLHLELGSRIFLDTSHSLELTPYISLTSLRGETDKHFGVSLGLQTAPQIQLQLFYGQNQDNDLQSMGLAVRVNL